jgi:uncharacterized repeat protein (TIGR01451 family)
MGCGKGQQLVRAASVPAVEKGALIAACLCLLLGVSRVPAQDFILTLTNTPSPILLGSNITYSLTVSNATGLNLNPGVITSEYNSNAAFVSATNEFGFTNTPGLVVFAIPTSSFPKDGVIRVGLELRGTNVGFLTNTFRVAISDDGRTTPATNQVISSIELPPEADLGLSIRGPVNGVFPGDSFSYQLLVTNAGPDTAEPVMVTNPFPAQVSLLSLSPTGKLALVNGFILFSVGTLTNQQSAAATVTVLATNAASTNLISGTVGASGISDTNTANNSYTTNVPILTPLTNQIVASLVSTQRFNPQTGWMEQRVRLENVSTSGVDSVRLLVGGLTNLLVNVTGTNGTTPYVAHGAPLEGGQAMELVLEYFNPARTAGGDPTLTAYGTPRLDLTPLEGTGITVSRIVQIGFTNLNHGRMLLEWPGTAGARYQVVYDEQASFSESKGSLPVVATPSGANRLQWLDYGPPRTLSAPSNVSSRFYQVIELP